jgi:hypothetical protein
MDQNRHCEGWPTLQRTKINIVRIDKQCKKPKSTLHAMAKNPRSQNCNGKKRDVQKYFVKIAICINMILLAPHAM